MGIFTHGQPVQRIYLGATRITRVYLGPRLVWSDISAGVIGARVATLTATAHPPKVIPGFGAVVARMSVQMRAPTVSAHYSVTVPRAQVSLAMRAPDLPKVAAAVVATMTTSMIAPQFRNTEVVSARPGALTLAMLPPVVGVAVAPPSATLAISANPPVPHAGASIVAIVAALNVAARAPAYGIGVQAVAAILTVQAQPPALSATVSVTSVAAGLTLAAGIPTIATGVAAVVATLATAAVAPVISAGSAVLAVVATSTKAAAAPVISASSGVAATVATVSVAAPAPVVTAVQFAASRMTKNGSVAIGTTSPTYGAVQNWTADTSGFPGSTVSSHALVANGGKTNALLEAQCNCTNGSAGAVSGQLQILVNGTVRVTGSSQSVTGFGTSNVTASGTFTVVNGDLITLQATSSFAGSLTINTGANTFVKIS